MCPGAGFALSEYSHVFSFAIQLVSSCCGLVGPPHMRKLDWTNTGCILGEWSAQTGFQTRFICLCDSVRHSIEASNGRVW